MTYKSIKVFLLIFITSMTIACGEPKIDTSTASSFDESIKKVQGAFSPTDAADFEEVINEIKNKINLFRERGQSVDEIYSELDGKTGNEILAWYPAYHYHSLSLPEQGMFHSENFVKEIKKCELSGDKVCTKALDEMGQLRFIAQELSKAEDEESKKVVRYLISFFAQFKK